MKRILLIIVLLLLVGLAGAAQVLRPMSVANALRGTNGLLSIRPSTNQTTLVLGEETAGDTDARIATHAASWGATNNTDIFDAVGGGQWKLASIGGGSSGSSPVPLVTLDCSDATKHDVTVVLNSGVYTLNVNQSNSTNASGTLTLTASDTTTHAVTVVLSQGIYTLRIAQ